MQVNLRIQRITFRFTERWAENPRGKPLPQRLELLSQACFVKDTAPLRHVSNYKPCIQIKNQPTVFSTWTGFFTVSGSLPSPVLYHLRLFTVSGSLPSQALRRFCSQINSNSDISLIMRSSWSLGHRTESTSPSFTNTSSS